MSLKIEVYEDERGFRPFEEWFDKLPAAHAAKVTTAVVRLEVGNRSGLKSVGEGVWEWRIDWGPGIRIYLAFDGLRLIILLGGGTKSRQQADIARSLQRWSDYKRRKNTKE
ncbi:putative addiction module killer protein [Phyllobacterium ifriqiyense]|jgi:putative addiction module killer protein|uniref:Addiction module killer protein n=1 Tax=Phyllobacterium ifriqiyense TaxID=314238 RepID=A0ABU0S6B2_9HYPH|nr:type II toxin-antitoxin system RelE/ParE family toxin [Phyllobacterium ifriqiyense]MDQ0996285.1 putative addiction module killer protein [Phyllobacterium ifriqiyense]